MQEEVEVVQEVEGTEKRKTRSRGRKRKAEDEEVQVSELDGQSGSRRNLRKKIKF